MSHAMDNGRPKTDGKQPGRLNRVLTCPLCEHQFGVAAQDPDPAKCPDCGHPVPLLSRVQTDSSTARFNLPTFGVRPLPGRGSQVGFAVALVLATVLGLTLVSSFGEKVGTKPDAPSRGLQIRHRPPTCAQWRMRLERSILAVHTETIAGVDRVRFEQIMGRPARTDWIEGHTVWHYTCADGEMCLDLDASLLAQKGQIVGRIIEHADPSRREAGHPIQDSQDIAKPVGEAGHSFHAAVGETGVRRSGQWARR